MIDLETLDEWEKLAVKTGGGDYDEVEQLTCVTCALIAELRELYLHLHDIRAGVLDKSDEAFEVLDELRDELRQLPDTPALLLKHRLKGKGGSNG